MRERRIPFLLILICLFSLIGCGRSFLSEAANTALIPTNNTEPTEALPIPTTENLLPTVADPMQMYANPTLDSIWYADCDECIELYTQPDQNSESVTSIPAFEEFSLLNWEKNFAFVDYMGMQGYVSAGDIQPVGEYEATSIPWTPNCEEFICLLRTPGGEDPIVRVLRGEHITLEQWCGKYALVSYKGIKGYVPANYIKPANEDFFSECLKVVSPTCQYTYEQLCDDVAALQTQYPERVTASVIGASGLGREIPVLQIGNPEAEYHVLIQGAIHGLEHQTAWLAMAIADFYLSQDYFDAGMVCYHIIPMVNPDGVVISQSCELEGDQWTMYYNDLATGQTVYSPSLYAMLWKANAAGVDLNRNFPSGWENCYDRWRPSSQLYQGTAPFSEPESIALRDYTLKHDFDATISLHSFGSLIYYQYGEKQLVNDQSKSLAQTVERLTGYPLEEWDGTGGAGYKDWAMDELEIPSLTIEIGCTSSPLEERDIYDTFSRLQYVLPAINAWLMRN